MSVLQSFGDQGRRGKKWILSGPCLGLPSLAYLDLFRVSGGGGGSGGGIDDDDHSRAGVGYMSDDIMSELRAGEQSGAGGGGHFGHIWVVCVVSPQCYRDVAVS